MVRTYSSTIKTVTMTHTFVLFLLIGFIMQSCVTHDINYVVDLSNVESLNKSKEHIVDFKIINFRLDGMNLCRFEDDNMEIVWRVSRTEFNFELKNKTENLIKVNWNDVAYVDINGRVSRMAHKGIKLSERNSSQPSTVIPKSAVLSDILIPTDNIHFTSGKYNSSWSKEPLIPFSYKSHKYRLAAARSNVGKKMSVLMPIIMEGVQYYYTFEFTVSNIEEKKYTVRH